MKFEQAGKKSAYHFSEVTLGLKTVSDFSAFIAISYHKCYFLSKRNTRNIYVGVNVSIQVDNRTLRKTFDERMGDVSF